MNEQQKERLSVISDYDAFLASKRAVTESFGFNPAPLSPHLFDFQQAVAKWAIVRGRAAIFAGTGMGKTAMQLEWARQVHAHADAPVLIVAPLAVASQTVREGAKFGVEVTHCREASDLRPGVNITNYERFERFPVSEFAGIVLDESSILKSHDGKTRTALIEACQRTRYRLACTATPAPNDVMELANHAEFLGVSSRSEMLATYFVHDGGETQKWRLKGHAEEPFWEWLASWSVMFRSPSDLGYDDARFNLPELRMHQHIVEATTVPEGMLFAAEAQTLIERNRARKESTQERAEAAAAIVNAEPGEPWLIWCDLNAEANAVQALIPAAIQVAGADTPDVKEQRLGGFAEGSVRVLVSKPSIAGMGLNYQHCARVVFLGLSDSWEAYFQAIRRCWRFGQLRPVECHVVISSAEGAVLANIERKEKEASKMLDAMVRQSQIHSTMARPEREIEHITRDDKGDEFDLFQGDCVEVVRSLPSDSVHYSIFSPPFASLYTYTASERDMGNVKDHAEFYEHFGFLVKELYRVLMPGRLLSFHCMNLPTSKVRDGVIGLTDFRGDLIRMFRDAGFIFHSEVVIWKDPVTAMQRTKAIGLLYKQLRKDSALSRQGIPDYLVTMRKPGENDEPVTKTHESFPVDLWQNYASPVWMDINPSDTLQKDSAREDKDERHIAPLQLEVIRRAMRLWTNEGDRVLTPFLGIGSEAFVAVQMRRHAIGAELKASYYAQAVENIRQAIIERDSTLFDISYD